MRAGRVPALCLAGAASLALLAAGALPSAAVDLRLEKARQAGKAILDKRRRDQGPPPDPFAEAEAAARARLEGIDAALADARAKAETLAEPKGKLAARVEELYGEIEALREQGRSRVGAIWRGGRLGTGAAGWHQDPQRSSRLARYLVAIAAAQGKRVDKLEVEHGAAMAALDRARAEEASAVAGIRVLEADRAEAEAALGRAVDDLEAAARRRAAGEEPLLPGGFDGEDGTGDGADDGEAVPDEDVAASLDRDEDGVAGNGAEDLDWPDGTPPPGESGDGGEGGGAAGAEQGAATGAATGTGPGATDADAPAPGEAPASAAGDGQRGFLNRLFGDDRESDRFASARGTLAAPVPGRVVASYGQQHKSGATYRGVVLRASGGATVRAVADGRVSFAGNVAGLGNTVIVSHGNRYHTVYARLGSLTVQHGDSVASGVQVGSLPDEDADMHFEVRDQGKPVDPLPWLAPGSVPGSPQP